jgi:hypothetical protein
MKKNRCLRWVWFLLVVLFAGCNAFLPPERDITAQISAMETQISVLSTRSASSEQVISYLATQLWAGYSTPFPADPSPTPYRPVIGGILLENGACCVGGPAGEPLEIEAVLEARNPDTALAVQEMRLLSGGRPVDEAELGEVAWEPYAPVRSFVYEPPINWSGFTVCVQFRDVEGNLSTVTCDDISVEGSPPSPTP